MNASLAELQHMRGGYMHKYSNLNKTSDNQLPAYTTMSMGTGYASKDKPWLKYYNDEVRDICVPKYQSLS